MRVRQKRGKSVRLQKKPRTDYFKFLDPYSNDKLLKNKAAKLEAETKKNRKPEIPEHKKTNKTQKKSKKSR